MNPIKRLWDSIEKWYLELNNPTFIEIAFVIIFTLISYVTLLTTFGKLITEDINILYKIIIFGLMLLFSITLIILIRKLRWMRYQIQERNKFIEVFANEINPKYIIKNFCETHEIKQNGDSYFKREVTLEYTEMIVPWYEMFMGSTNNLPLENIIKIKVINPDNNQPLANLPYKIDGDRSYHAIILNPVLSPRQRISKILLLRRWIDIWNDLIEKNEDQGTINVKYYTKNLILYFILPKSLEFVSYNITPKIGNWKEETDQQGRACLKFSAKSVNPRTYHYSLHTRKI